MTKDELIELAREGMEMHSPKAPEYIVCAALIEALAQPEHSCVACEGNPKGNNNPCAVCGLAQPDVDRRSTESKETFDQQEPVAWESLLGAVARGWCYEKNANKTMDVDLAVAIAKEVDALYTTPPSNSVNSIKSSNTLDAQRKPLTDEQWQVIADTLDCLITRKQKDAIEAVIGIKE